MDGIDGRAKAQPEDVEELSSLGEALYIVLAGRAMRNRVTALATMLCVCAQEWRMPKTALGQCVSKCYDNVLAVKAENK